MKTNFNFNGSFDPDKQTMPRLNESEDGYNLGNEHLKMQSQVLNLFENI